MKSMVHFLNKDEVSSHIHTDIENNIHISYDEYQVSYAKPMKEN